MFLKHIKLIFIIFFAISVSFGQVNRGKITGRVIDASTREPIIGANIIIIGTSLGAAANNNGEFEIDNLKEDNYQLVASAIGFSSVTKTDIIVSSSKPARVDFELREIAVELNTVTVTNGYFTKDLIEANSIRNFNNEEIRRSPGGFEDVVRALSVLPGVAQADAGRNDLIVRGGAPSENLYLIDGIEVQNINHFGNQGATGGPLSYINLDFVKQTSFSTGGFSSLYGDKISSILKIDLKSGRKDRIGGKATISATQFGLDLEGPFGKDNSFILSARRSYLDFIFKAAGFGFVPEYYDVLSKADFKINTHNYFSFLFIGAFDNVRYFNNTADQRYDNSMVLGSDQLQYTTGITYTSLFQGGFAKFVFSRNFMDYNTSQKDSMLNPIFSNKSLEAENTLKGDVVYKFSKKMEMNFGAEIKQAKLKADILFPNFQTSFGNSLPVINTNTNRYYTKSSAYINFNTFITDKLISNLGLRMDYFDVLNRKFYFSPRLSFIYEISGSTNLNFSTGIYYQSPSYIWLTYKGNSQSLIDLKANQFVLGVDTRLREDVQVKMEAFLKSYNNYPTSLIRPYLILSNTGAGFSGSSDNFSSFGLEPLVSAGTGLAKGIELSVQKKLSSIPIYGIMSLTYSKADYKALDGITRTGSYDQRWIFNISGGYKINPEWEAGIKFRYSSGKPYTPFNEDGTQNSSAYNTLLLPPNHSLDIRIDKHWFFQNWTLITYIDIQNIYNRANKTFVRWDPRTKSIKDQASIGILPSIGISAEI